MSWFNGGYYTGSNILLLSGFISNVVGFVFDVIIVVVIADVDDVFAVGCSCCKVWNISNTQRQEDCHPFSV